jgi:hypothetical protein
MSADDTSQPSPPPPLSDSGDGKENSPAGSRFLDSPSSALASTVACPNCGRRFTGTYCPTCGQKADAELTIWDIVGGFFRDLVDVTRGFWPTFGFWPTLRA